MKEFVVIYEWAGENWSAYCPDVAGCVAVGDTLDEVKRNMREAMTIWFEEMHALGLPIPESKAIADMISLSVPEPAHRTDSLTTPTASVG